VNGYLRLGLIGILLTGGFCGYSSRTNTLSRERGALYRRRRRRSRRFRPTTCLGCFHRRREPRILPN
jgi:hypothetical protein